MSTDAGSLHPHVPELLARIQVCVDQLVGVANIKTERGADVLGDLGWPHMLRVLAILQDQLGGLQHHTADPTSVDFIEASTWLLGELAKRRRVV